MREYWAFLTLVFPYKDRIEDYVLVRENTGQRKLVFSHILCCGAFSAEFRTMKLTISRVLFS